MPSAFRGGAVTNLRPCAARSQVASFFGDAEDPEIFQMEPVDDEIWNIKTVNATYFTMKEDGKIMSNHSVSKLNPLGFNEVVLALA